MDEPEDIASLLINLNGLNDLFNGEDMFGDDWLPKPDVQVASRGDSGSIHEQDQNTGAPPKDPPPRKRGRPKGSLNATISNVSSKELQDELESKMAALELLQQENQLLNQHMSMLELVVQARDEQLHRLQLIQAGHADAALASLKTTVKEMGEMSLREMAQRCKDLMSQVGGLLLHSELKGDRRPLDAHMTSLQEAIKFCTLLRPDGLLLSGRDVTEMCASVEDASLAPQGHWQVVVTQMQLSAEQCRQAWVLSELYNRWHARLLADRTAITAALSQLLSVPRYGPVYNSAYLAGVTDAILLEKLHSSLVRERCLIALVGDVFRARILHDTQLAQQWVHSYPYCPDDIAILTTSAARHAPPTPPMPLALFPTLPTASLLPPAVPDPRDTEPPLPLARASTNESRSSTNNLSNPNSSTNLNSLPLNL